MPLDTSSPEVPAQPSSLRWTPHIEELSEIHEPGTNVVRFHRPLLPKLHAEAVQLSQRSGFRMLATLNPGRRGKQDLSADLAAFPCLASDIGVWVEVLADLTGCAVVAVRLVNLDRAMCPRLHVDSVCLRLVVTYKGPGTQYVDSAGVDRSFLGHAGFGASDERSGLLRPGALVHAAESGDIVLLKGERWHGNEGNGAIHRSPQASAERPRLVMTMDALWH